MSHRSSSCALALVVALSVTIADALADDMKYPNWKGEWVIINPRVGGQRVRFDPSKRFGPAQQAPLTPEYQKILEDSMADQVKGGQGNFALCRPAPPARDADRDGSRGARIYYYARNDLHFP